MPWFSWRKKKEKDQRGNGERRERMPRKDYDILIFFKKKQSRGMRVKC
jgi:hypothetical protein